MHVLAEVCLYFVGFWVGAIVVAASLYEYSDRTAEDARLAFGFGMFLSLLVCLATFGITHL